jgi:hypothetical protein
MKYLRALCLVMFVCCACVCVHDRYQVQQEIMQLRRGMFALYDGLLELQTEIYIIRDLPPEPRNQDPYPEETLLPLIHLKESRVDGE